MSNLAGLPPLNRPPPLGLWDHPLIIYWGQPPDGTDCPQTDGADKQLSCTWGGGKRPGGCEHQLGVGGFKIEMHEVSKEVILHSSRGCGSWRAVLQVAASTGQVLVLLGSAHRHLALQLTSAHRTQHLFP